MANLATKEAMLLSNSVARNWHLSFSLVAWQQYVVVAGGKRSWPFLL